MKFLDRFNAWYDGLKEPWRFLLFMGWSCSWLLPLEIGLDYKNQTSIMIGAIGMVVMCVVALYRSWNFK